MADDKIEQARACPKCRKPMTVKARVPRFPNSGYVIFLECRDCGITSVDVREAPNE